MLTSGITSRKVSPFIRAAKKVLVCFAVWAMMSVLAVQAQAEQPDIVCPSGWTYVAFDDSCVALNPLSPAEPHHPSTARALMLQRTFDQARTHCRQFGADLPIITDLGTQLDAIDGVVGRASGLAWWIWATRNPQLTYTAANVSSAYVSLHRRHAGFVFDWAADEPRVAGGDCVVQWMKGDAHLRGGTQKMSTSSCGTPRATVCVRPRRSPTINSINGASASQRVQIYSNETTVLLLEGPYIPSGAGVSLQPFGFPSRPALSSVDVCRRARNTQGVSTPLFLSTPSLTTSSTMVANLTLPSTLPLQRGIAMGSDEPGKYALCFFFPFAFPTPLLPAEFALTFGVSGAVEVVQRSRSFQRDVCERRRVIREGLSNSSVVEQSSSLDVLPFTSRVEGRTLG